jgi:transcriptional regulator with XRE-family HTH domain
MKNLLKKGREKTGYSTREVSILLNIDQALISKFENGQRLPTRTQISQLSELLKIDLELLTVAWFKQKILKEINNDALGLRALSELEKELAPTDSSALDELFQEMESLKNKMESLRQKGV